MTTIASPSSEETRQPVAQRAIDVCVHHRWASHHEGDVLLYLPENWQKYVGKPGTLPLGGGARKTIPVGRYPNPSGDILPEAVPADGSPAGSSLDGLRARLDHASIDRALLVHNPETMIAPAAENPYLVGPFVRAMNDWTIDQWLERDPRLYGAVIVNTQHPGEAAVEIRRIGPHPKMAAVLLCVSGSGRLFGHPSYFPIYEAACELDLPVIIHRGGDPVPQIPMSDPAGGNPFTFAEYNTLAPIALMSHLMSFISNGVFGVHPKLRLCLFGTGIWWIPGFLRRHELSWKAFRREVPWATESPRETFLRHVRVATYGLEVDVERSKTAALLAQNPYFADVLLYGSGYPSWDTNQAGEIESIFPAEWHRRMLFENADTWFPWESDAS